MRKGKNCFYTNMPQEEGMEVICQTDSKTKILQIQWRTLFTDPRYGDIDGHKNGIFSGSHRETTTFIQPLETYYLENIH